MYEQTGRHARAHVPSYQDAMPLIDDGARPSIKPATASNGKDLLLSRKVVFVCAYHQRFQLYHLHRFVSCSRSGRDVRRAVGVAGGCNLYVARLLLFIRLLALPGAHARARQQLQEAQSADTVLERTTQHLRPRRQFIPPCHALSTQSRIWFVPRAGRTEYVQYGIPYHRPK
eukprot:6188457-Pleurochrysis_carterae.AAC.6